MSKFFDGPNMSDLSTKICYRYLLRMSNYEKMIRHACYSATRLTVATQQTFLQVSQSRYANLIDRHASIKSFNTQLPSENLSILTDKVEAKAQQLYKT